jgi:hypothetical protein
MSDIDESRHRFTSILDRYFRQVIDEAARKSDRSTGAYIRTAVRERLRRDHDQRDDLR